MNNTTQTNAKQTARKLTDREGNQIDVGCPVVIMSGSHAGERRIGKKGPIVAVGKTLISINVGIDEIVKVAPNEVMAWDCFVNGNW